MIRSHRKDVGRIKAGRCTAHNLPIEQSDTFDGGVCPRGCVVSNLVRTAFLQKTRQGWRRD